MMMKQLSNKKKSSWQNFLLLLACCSGYGKTTEIVVVVGLLCGEGDVCEFLIVGFRRVVVKLFARLMMRSFRFSMSILSSFFGFWVFGVVAGGARGWCFCCACVALLLLQGKL